MVSDLRRTVTDVLRCLELTPLRYHMQINGWFFLALHHRILMSGLGLVQFFCGGGVFYFFSFFLMDSLGSVLG